MNVLITGKFARCEGISFNGEGKLFVTCDRGLWQVERDGGAYLLATLYSNLGLAPIGERDLLVADFGPTNAFDHGPNSDGIVWRATPDGDLEEVATGIGDPNFIAVLEDGSFLVSDDAVDEIWRVVKGASELVSTAVNHPNGMVVSLDGSELFVAQIFDGIDPIVWDNRIWRLPLTDGVIGNEAGLLCECGEGHDGLAMDRLGRIYSASNNSGEILRIDPASGEVVVVAEGIHGVASLAFGRGEFDNEAIYATNHRTGELLEINVGIGGVQHY